jgi:putative transposase
MKLILIPPDEGLPDGVYQVLNPHGSLTKPFYMPNLLSTVRQVLAWEKTPTADGTEAQSLPKQADAVLPARSTISTRQTPPWLQNVEQAAQHLTRLSLGSAALGALITREDQLFAYAGELPQPAVDELAHAVTDDWANNGGTDLARFIRLDATNGEYMLYATSLADELVLSLVFDAQTPFSEIRTQAWRLARALVNYPNERTAREEKPADSQSKPDAKPETSPSPREIPVQRPEPVFNGYQLDSTPFEPGQEGFGERVPTTFDIMGLQNDQPDSQRMSESMTTESTPFAPSPVSPGVSHLEYTCVLIPRMPQHGLAGDLAQRFDQWISQLCLAFSWRLIYLAAKNDHLVWSLQMHPHNSPADMVQRVRQTTSKRIFQEFPHLKINELAEDFWAPGYLVITGSQLPTGPTVQSYLRRVRSWQGTTGDLD